MFGMNNFKKMAMKRFIGVMLLHLLLISSVLAQDVVVEGTVKDNTGQTLPGVNIVVEGTFTGTVTNMDGYYSLNLSSSDVTLVFSFIGMNTIKEEVKGRSKIDVTMSDDSRQLKDVMVVAYGTSTKEAFTGAAEVISSEKLEDRPVTSFEKALQGTTAGLQVTSSSGQPGSTATVRIRGIGSLSANSSPLYVIDGVAMSGGLGDINSNDIESLTVLKDAAASSLYGSRAANGVVIITTKQGKKGKTKISFDAQYGISSRISDGYRLMNSSEIYEHSWKGLYNQSLLKGGTIAEAREFAHDNVEQIVGFNPFAIENPLDANGKVVPGTKVITDTDWRDKIYKKGVTQNYNLSVSGGTEATKVYFSLGYFNDNGTTLESDFTRYSSKVNVTHKVNDFITAGISNHVSYSITHAPPGGTGGANPVRSAEVINAATPIYNADGSYNWGNKAIFDFNPIGLAELDEYEYITKRALVNAYLNFQLLPSLSFRTTGAIDYSDDDALNYYNPFHGNGAGVGGRNSSSSSNNMSWNLTNILSWNKTTDDSSFEMMLGQEAHAEKYSVLSAGATDFGIPDHTELAWASQPEMPGSASTEWSMISYFGQFKYNYGGKYYLSASLRNDGSSRFGENNKYGWFYSLGGSWRISEENWMPEISWLNNLKMRASYGTSGNNSIGNFASFGLYGSGANYGGMAGISPIQLPQPDLQWEKITSLNVGLEARLMNRLSATLEYYTRNSDALLFGRPLSASKGFGSILTNLGAMKNSGFEMSLDLDVIKQNELTWNMGFNISTNKNEIINLETGRMTGATQIREKGGDVHQFFMREWAGVNPDNGRPMWYTNVASDDEDGSEEPTSAFKDPAGSGKMVTSNYSDAERTRQGSALPEFYGGLSNNIKYKNFDLSFYFYYSLGGQVYNYDYVTNMHDGTNPGSNLAADALDAWTPNNQFTDVPRYVTNNEDQGNQISTRFLEDASYLRLKNISLGYYLPESLCTRIRVNRLKVFVSGENLWTLTDYKGFDPEGGISGTTNNSIPGVKVFTFGVKMDL